MGPLDPGSDGLLALRQLFVEQPVRVIIVPWRGSVDVAGRLNDCLLFAPLSANSEGTSFRRDSLERPGKLPDICSATLSGKRIKGIHHLDR